MHVVPKTAAAQTSVFPQTSVPQTSIPQTSIPQTTDSNGNNGKGSGAENLSDYRMRKAQMLHDPRDRRSVQVSMNRKQQQRQRHDKAGNVVFCKSSAAGGMEIQTMRPLLTIGEPRLAPPVGGGMFGSRKWVTVKPLLEDGEKEEHHLDALAPLKDALLKLLEAHSNATEEGGRKKIERVVHASIDKQHALREHVQKSDAELCEQLSHERGKEIYAVFIAGSRD